LKKVYTRPDQTPPPFSEQQNHLKCNVSFRLKSQIHRELVVPQLAQFHRMFIHRELVIPQLAQFHRMFIHRELVVPRLAQFHRMFMSQIPTTLFLRPLLSPQSPTKLRM